MRRTNLDRESKHQMSYKSLPVDAVATLVPNDNTSWLPALSRIPSAVIVATQPRIRDPIVNAYNTLRSQNVNHGFFRDLGNVDINRDGTVRTTSQYWTIDGNVRRNRRDVITDYNIVDNTARQIGESRTVNHPDSDASEPSLLDRMFGRRR